MANENRLGPIKTQCLNQLSTDPNCLLKVVEIINSEIRKISKPQNSITKFTNFFLTLLVDNSLLQLGFIDSISNNHFGSLQSIFSKLVRKEFPRQVGERKVTLKVEFPLPKDWLDENPANPKVAKLTIDDVGISIGNILHELWLFHARCSVDETYKFEISLPILVQSQIEDDSDEDNEKSDEEDIQPKVAIRNLLDTFSIEIIQQIVGKPCWSTLSLHERRILLSRVCSGLGIEFSQSPIGHGKSSSSANQKSGSKPSTAMPKKKKVLSPEEQRIRDLGLEISRIKAETGGPLPRDHPILLRYRDAIASSKSDSKKS